MAKSLMKVLASLDSDTVLEDGVTGETFTVEEVLDLTEGSNDAAEPALIQGDEIYFTTDSGDLYTAATPAYIIKSR